MELFWCGMGHSIFCSKGELKVLRSLAKIVGIFIVVSCGVVWCVSSPLISYDNTTCMDNLISKEYSNAQMGEMIRKIDSESYTAAQFRKDFHMECLRKNSEGYYTVFRQDDGKHVYVFLKDDLTPIANATMIVDRFKSKEAFESFISKQTTMNDIIQFDSSTIFPFSGRRASMHQVIEGIVIIDYFPAETYYEAKVAHVEFFDNQELRDMGSVYVLDIDKIY